MVKFMSYSKFDLEIIYSSTNYYQSADYVY